MASVNLEEIKTLDIVHANDPVNLEVICGKFGLSFRSSLSAMGSFFLKTTELEAITSKIDTFDLWLNGLVDYSKEDYLMSKDTMDNRYLYKSESNWYYKRLLTDEVMESVCSEYANEKMLSGMIYECQKRGQFVATELANELAKIAAIVKSQAIINDTNCQLNSNEIEGMFEGAEVMAETISDTMNAISEAIAEAQAAAEAAAAAGEAGGGGEGGGGETKIKLTVVSYHGGSKLWVVTKQGGSLAINKKYSSKSDAIAAAKALAASNPMYVY